MRPPPAVLSAGASGPPSWYLSTSRVTATPSSSAKAARSAAVRKVISPSKAKVARGCLAAAEASLDPIRTRILLELAEPGSATQLAAKVGLPRQKVNYHLKALERHGLVELVAERRKGNVTERILQASAASYLISPAALASVAPDPHRFSDRFSAFWLLALAGRMVQEVGKLIARSEEHTSELQSH